MSAGWNVKSWTTPPHLRQSHRRWCSSAEHLGCSTTSPTVFAGRCGECGTFVAGVDVVIRPGVRPADDHDQELPVAPDRPIADRRLEQVAVLVDPALQVERGEGHEILQKRRASSRQADVSSNKTRRADAPTL